MVGWDGMGEVDGLWVFGGGVGFVSAGYGDGGGLGR